MSSVTTTNLNTDQINSLPIGAIELKGMTVQGVTGSWVISNLVAGVPLHLIAENTRVGGTSDRFRFHTLSGAIGASYGTATQRYYGFSNASGTSPCQASSCVILPTGPEVTIEVIENSGYTVRAYQ